MNWKFSSTVSLFSVKVPVLSLQSMSIPAILLLIAPCSQHRLFNNTSFGQDRVVRNTNRPVGIEDENR
ncbi:hypothetical protein AKJ16_DCAP04544 [Drosera capensis]